jgi:chemotaxis protein MotA
LSPNAIAAPGELSAPRPAAKRLDLGIFSGILLALTALIAGIAYTGLRLSSFIQGSGLLIVFGGTLGVLLVTTPFHALRNAVKGVGEVIWEPIIDRAALVEDLLLYVRTARANGLLAIEPILPRARHPMLRETLRLALDVQRRDLQTAVETRLRLRERRGEAAAKTFEVAGGFAPAIGVLGTVVGLVDILHKFSDIASVATGVGMAFSSTLYGLGLANLILLPLAHRIRATVAGRFETEEMILEGALCLLDGVHPSLVSERLKAYLPEDKP